MTEPSTDPECVRERIREALDLILHGEPTLRAARATGVHQWVIRWRIEIVTDDGKVDPGSEELVRKSVKLEPPAVPWGRPAIKGFFTLSQIQFMRSEAEKTGCQSVAEWINETIKDAIEEEIAKNKRAKIRKQR